MGVRRASGGVAVLLLLAACGQGSPDADVAARPSPEEVVCLGGGYAEAEMGEVVPRDEVCQEEPPSATPSPSASPSPAASSPAAAASWELSAAFLTPEAAADVDPGGWAVLADAEPEAGPLLDPCGANAFPQLAEVAASAERSIGWRTDDPGGSDVVQEVFRYSSAAVAEQAFVDYADAVERCPRVDDEQAEGYYLKHAVVRQDEAGGVRRLLVRRQPCAPPNACTAHFASYLMVAQAADGVTAASYGLYTDGDPAEVAPLVLAAVAEQLGRAVTGDASG